MQRRKDTFISSHTHTRTRTRTHTHTHAHMHAHMHTHTCTLFCSLPHTHTYAHTLFRSSGVVSVIADRCSNIKMCLTSLLRTVIQINIKRCHSDGCDTRVHGIKTLGYKVVRESGLSVVDASAKWYLQILAATVAATVPQSPGLRMAVLEHTK